MAVGGSGVAVGGSGVALDGTAVFDGAGVAVGMPVALGSAVGVSGSAVAVFSGVAVAGRWVAVRVGRGVLAGSGRVEPVLRVGCVLGIRPVEVGCGVEAAAMASRGVAVGVGASVALPQPLSRKSTRNRRTNRGAGVIRLTSYREWFFSETNGLCYKWLKKRVNDYIAGKG